MCLAEIDTELKKLQLKIVCRILPVYDEIIWIKAQALETYQLMRRIASVPDLKLDAQEDKDVDPVSVSPGCALEPLQSHTSSLKNNAAGLSSDEHENSLNGTQPNPFVYSSVPAVPHAGNSLPSGALVNGPGSHPTSEVHCVLNKGSVLSNNVLDAAWQAEKDTSPEVLPPPSELQSDAWKNTAGPVVKTPATQPGVNTPRSHSEENESKLAYCTLSGDGVEQMHISQPLTKQTMKTRSRRDAEWSESSSDDYDDAEVIRWYSTRDRLLHNDRRLETKVTHQRDRKHKTLIENMSGSAEKVNNSLNHTCTHRPCVCGCNNAENVDIANTDDSSSTQSGIKYSIVPLKGLSENTASDSEPRIYSSAQEGSNEENDPEDEDSSSPKAEQIKTEKVEQDPLFFSCTKCNVNYKEKRHFHEHMMYHLGKNNQVRSEKVSQPFICGECGRLFCDSRSLMRHVVIHQDRLEKLMEEIKGLKNAEFEDKGGTEQSPQCESDLKIFVQRAKTHDNLRHYYFCEECNYVSLTQQALKAHLSETHLDKHKPQYKMETCVDDEKKVNKPKDISSSTNKVILERKSESKGRYLTSGNLKMVACKPTVKPLKSKALLPHISSQNMNIYCKKSMDKTKHFPRFPPQMDCTESIALPSLWRVDLHGKLLLLPAGKLDPAPDFTCKKKDARNNNCKAFGRAKQENCPANTDSLLFAKNPKLDQMFCQDRKSDWTSGTFQVNVKQNSPLTRNLSAPLHKTIDNKSGFKWQRLSQRHKRNCADLEMEKGCKGSISFSDDTNGATGSFLESSENERNPYARRYFKKKQRFSARDQSPRVLEDEDGGDEDCSDIEQLIIKEECMDTIEWDGPAGSLSTTTSKNSDVFSTPDVELKPCLYCPAVFDSGVGLSNHIRGHLHRAGVSYNARHMVTPEQVAMKDHQQRLRRRIPHGRRIMSEGVKAETGGKHKCSLCWAWFDTKTGLSNHVRGHLKRIGSGVTITGKSPVSVLNKLLQDKKEHPTVFHAFNKSWPPTQFLVSQKLTSRGAPFKTRHKMDSPHSLLDNLVPKQESVVEEEGTLEVNTQNGTKASQSTLIKLLQMKEEKETISQEVRSTRKSWDLNKDYKEEKRMTSVELQPLLNRCDSKTVLIQCNSTFPKPLGHLGSRAHRKKISMFEGQGCNYKQKKLKPRPGLKKKILSSLNTELYSLSCRFCDLVFQGPPSIQEDWIKHLQRHLLHTDVPRSGTGMVDVHGLHHKIQINMSEEQQNLQ